MIFNFFIFLLVAALGVYVYLDFKQKKLIINQINKNTDDISNFKKEYKDAVGYIGKQVEKTVKHGDKITLKSTAHQGHRLQDHGNKLAKFENKNRGGWEQLLVEKCGLAGIGDNQGCW